MKKLNNNDYTSREWFIQNYGKYNSGKRLFDFVKTLFKENELNVKFDDSDESDIDNNNELVVDNNESNNNDELVVDSNKSNNNELIIDDNNKKRELLACIHLQSYETLIDNDKIWLQICKHNDNFVYKPTDKLNIY